MVLQQCSLLVAQALCNVLAFLLRQNNAVEAIVYHMVIVESASVLSQRIQLASQRTECAAINGVAVSSTVDIRPRSMNGRVNHVGGGVEETAFASIDDLAGVVDQDEI